jgi:hypothetical protein
MASNIGSILCLMSSPASGFGDKTSSYPQILCFLCVVYQAAIISQRELRLLGGRWLRRKQQKRQERTRGRKARNTFGRARRSDEIRADLFVILSGFYFIPALQIARE